MAKLNSSELLKRIEVGYNPYIYEFKILKSTMQFTDNSKLTGVIEDNKDKALHYWYKKIFLAIEEDCNSKEFELVFIGRIEEYSDILEEVEYLNENGWEIILELQEKKTNEHIVKKLEEFIVEIDEKGPEELKKEIKEKKAIEEFENAKNSEAEVSVVATMSAGKSTLINAMLGEELLPSKNEACTATICRITDIDNSEEFRMKVENVEGELILDWEKAELEKLNAINDKGNEEGIIIYMEGDITGIDSSEMNLVVIDTPGPNNSQNQEHKASTYRFIKDTQNNPLVLYVMNATQHGTNDDAQLLREIAEIIRKNGKQAEERFIFALNKIDQFDPETESIEKLIDNSIKYLESFGIKNPRIFPISAEAAKLVRLEQKGLPLTRVQKNNLSSYRNTIVPDEKDGYEGIDTIKYASISEKMKKELYEEAKLNEEVALLNYSGISAIEKYIDRYVNKYAKTQKIKDAVSTLKRIIDIANSEVKVLSEKTKEEIEELIKQIKKVEEVLKTQGKKELEETKKQIKNLEISANLDEIHKKIETEFRKMQEEFSKTKIQETKARIIIEEVKENLERLVLSLQTTAEMIAQEELKKKSEEIVKMLQNKFKQILNDNTLEIELKETLVNKIKLEIPKVSSMLSTGEYVERERVGSRYVRTVSRSKWYNPFSWGDKEDIYEDVYENKMYIDLTKIFHEKIRPIRNEIRNKVIIIETDLEENIKKLKNEAIKNTDLININIEKKLKEMQFKFENKGLLINKNEKLDNSFEIIKYFEKKLNDILGLE